MVTRSSEPDLSSPQTAGLAWIDAMTAGDMDMVHSVSIGTDEEFALAKNLGDYLRAMQRYNVAARKQFGEKAKRPEDTLQMAFFDLVPAIGQGDAKINGDTALLRAGATAGHPNPMLLPLKKVAGQWKMDLSWLDDDGASKVFAKIWMPSLAWAMDVTVNDIAAGKYKTIEEADSAMAQTAEEVGADNGDDPSPKARTERARELMGYIWIAIDHFKAANGRYPTTEEGIRALVFDPGNLPHWKQEFSRLALDPWGRLYQYRFPGMHGSAFDLYSTGPSGKDGADDNISSTSPANGK